jgi:hypothetical protein
MKTILFNTSNEKKGMETLDNEIFNIDNHIQYITFIKNNLDFKFKNIINTELKKKISSYKRQDKISKKFDHEQFITYDQLIDKLFTSQLKCFYCNEKVLLVYKNKKENKQWSLERFDNNIGHYSTNCCISCLKCNLQRRRDNYEYFKMGKQLRLKKV